MIRRGMCCLCLSLILGLLYGRGYKWQFLCLFVLLMSVMAAVVLRLQEHAGHAVCARVLLCVCLFCAAAGHMQKQQTVRLGLEESFSDGAAITVQGRVSRKVKTAAQDRGSQLGKALTEGKTQTFQKKQQFIYYLTDTRVFSDGSAYPGFGILIYSSSGQYQPGNVLKITGRYMPFQISRNEGNFNEKRYQQSRKCEFKVYADSETMISENENKYAVFLAELRGRMQTVFAESMASEDAGVMANITLGEKSLMEPEIKELYRDAGISHILAISGLHVSLLGMGILSLLQKIGCPRKWSALFAAGMVFSFGIFSGMEVSTARAVCMFALMMAAQVLGRSYDSLSALSFAAAIQLWENPFLLEYAGFLFSYGAVLGVAVVWKIIQDAGEETKKEKKQSRQLKTRSQNQPSNKHGKILQKAGQTVWDTLCVSACIQLATLPLSLYFYYEISLYSVLVNACILPFMGVLLSLGLVGGVLGSIVPVWGAVILKPAAWLLDFNENVCRMSRKLPGAEFITGKPPVELVIAYYIVFAICLYLLWRRKKKSCLAGVILALFCLLFARGKSGFEIDVLDVGQGDGIFIQNDNGEHFFVDGGSSDVDHVGEYRILPFLKSRGIRSVKGWIVSHADADHISGLVELLQQGYPVKHLILAEYMVWDEAMDSLLVEAGKAGCEIMYVSPGMEFGSGDMVFTVLAPGEDGTKSGADRNASSLSVLLEYRGFQGIFTGDIGEAQEEKLLTSGYLAQYGIENVDFYKAAHHGSNHSNSREFLDKLSPKMTVISCAKKNSYGHPGTEAIERIQAAGSRIFLTMEQGQIRIQPEEGDVRVWTYLP